MPLNYDSYDLYESDEGDLVIGADNSIVDTYIDPLLALGQCIRNRIKYLKGEHRLYPTIGCDESPIGLINNEDDSLFYKELLEAALTDDGVVLPEDLAIDIAPFDETTWIVSVFVTILPTPENGYRSTYPFFYLVDLKNGEVGYY